MKTSGNLDQLIIEGKHKEKHVSQRYNRAASPQFNPRNKSNQDKFNDEDTVFKDYKLLNQDLQNQKL